MHTSGTTSLLKSTILNGDSHNLKIYHLARRKTAALFKLDGNKSTLLKLSIGLLTGSGVKLWMQNTLVACDHGRDAGLVRPTKAVHGTYPRFDWNKFWGYLYPHKWYLLAAVVAAFLAAILNIQIPLLLGNVVNVLSRCSKEEFLSVCKTDLKASALKLIYMYVAQSIFTFSYIYSLFCVGERVALAMKRELFSSIIRQDIAFFDKNRTGELVNRLTADVQDFKSSLKLCVGQGLRSFTQVVGCAVSLYYISPQMTIGMLLIMPTVVITGTMIGSLLRKLSRRAQDQMAKATIVGEEAISNIRTVRAFAMEEKEVMLFTKEIEESKKLNEHMGFGVGIFQGGTNLFLNGIVLGTLYAGGYLLCTSQVSPGDLMAFLAATQTIQRSMVQLSLLFGNFLKGIEAGARVFEYINLKPSMSLTGGKKIPYHSLLGEVLFQGVTFSYPARPDQVILRQFNLRIPPGKMVALVGMSGGGKSTVAALLERFYDVDRGKITIDGEDVKDLDPEWLRGKLLGYINQEPILFATSIMENIRYGRPDATDQEVIEVAKLANADDFIQTFPEGYNTVVGERGVTVSGGQKQRIAIARALLKNPSILILDEATSALDSKSEKLVQEALDRVVTNRTVLVIAHRLSTIQHADIIAVMSNGVVVEIGTHETLKQRRGLYWNLISQQEREELEQSIQGG